MKTPTPNKTFLSKAVVFLCTIFLVALGLCGANVITVLYCCDDFISEVPNYVPKLTTRILMFTGETEVIVMAFCVAGILLLAIIAIGQAVADRLRNKK